MCSDHLPAAPSVTTVNAETIRAAAEPVCKLMDRCVVSRDAAPKASDKRSRLARIARNVEDALKSLGMALEDADGR